MSSVINQIKLGDVEYAIAASAYAECNTGPDEATKIARIITDNDETTNAFTLIRGVAIQVKFANTNHVDNPALNVNGTGAWAIKYKGAAIPATYLKGNSIYTFVFTGGMWELVGDIDTVNTDTKNTAGSTDTDSKIFLIGATSQAANTQTYSHEEVYVDSNHVLTDTVGFKAGSPMYCTIYKANSISYIDGNNVKAGTLNLPTDEDGTFTIATKEWTNTQLDDITDSISDIEQGMLINYDTNVLEDFGTTSAFEVYSDLKDDISGDCTKIRADGVFITDLSDGDGSHLAATYLDICDRSGEGTYYGMYGIRQSREADIIGIPVAAKTNDVFATQGWVEQNGGGGTSSHTHGNIANDGTLGTASRVVITDANKKVTTSSSITTTELGYLDGVTSNIQTQLDGKAASSHGTHVSFTTTTPKANGTAAVGTATTVSRSDHVHPTDTSRAPTSHASTGTSYGVGTSTNYGHVKIQNGDLNGKQHANGVVAGLEHTHSQYAKLTTNMEVEADGIVSGNNMTLETQRGGNLNLINETSDGTHAEVLLNTNYLHLSKQEPVNDEESSQINLYNDQLDLSVRGPANTTDGYDSEITSGISVSPHQVTIGDINGIDNDPEYDSMEVNLDADRVNLNATYAQVNNSKIMTASDFIYNSSTGILTINTSWED